MADTRGKFDLKCMQILSANFVCKFFDSYTFWSNKVNYQHMYKFFLKAQHVTCFSPYFWIWMFPRPKRGARAEWNNVLHAMPPGAPRRIGVNNLPKLIIFEVYRVFDGFQPRLGPSLHHHKSRRHRGVVIQCHVRAWFRVAKNEFHYLYLPSWTAKLQIRLKIVGN